MNGNGVIASADGLQCKGSLKDGYGECFTLDGLLYRGGWKHNKMHGQGVLIESGTKYEGNWNEGTKDGPGVFTD